VDDWPDQGYLPGNVLGHQPDPDDDTGSDICLGYNDDRIENRSSVIEQQDLDLHDIEDGSEAVERVARTTIQSKWARGRWNWLLHSSLKMSRNQGSNVQDVAARNEG
jgi:hypothetical protein